MAIYAAMVDQMDRNIGRVVDRLIQDNALDDTLIIFLSDNGACAEWDPWGFDIKSSPNNVLHVGDQIETMGGPGTFHSVGSGWANACNTPWRLYKHFNHEGGINSPCIIHWPRRIDRPGSIDPTATHIIDLMPTIAAATSTAYQGNIELPGRSFLPLLARRSLPARELFFEHEGNRAVLSQNWKLVARKDQPWQLYDTRTDRTELNDLASQHPEVVQALRSQWRQWAAKNQVTPLPADYHVPYLKPRAGDGNGNGD
jgi:arylsulfatase